MIKKLDLQDILFIIFIIICIILLIYQYNNTSNFKENTIFYYSLNNYSFDNNLCKNYSNLKEIKIHYINGNKYYNISNNLILEQTLHNYCLKKNGHN